MKKWNVAVIFVFCALLIAGSVYYVFFFSKKSGAGKGGFPGGFGGFGGGAQNVVSVKTMKASPITLHDYVITNGEISPQTSVDVFPNIGGKIVQVNVSLGSLVRKGETLALVDPSTPGVYYAKSPVTAPISGTITSSPLRQGTTVTGNTPITTIGDVANLQGTASVPERYVASLKTGLNADIVLEAYPDEIFTATVTKVSPVLDAKSRTKEVILNFDTSDSRVQAGMFARVKLWTEDYEGEFAVPSDSIIENGVEKYVFIIKSDNTAEKRIVTTGKSVDDFTQILTGLKEGETVVTEGMRVLSNGAQTKDITSGIIDVDYGTDKKTEAQKDGENLPPKGEH